MTDLIAARGPDRRLVLGLAWAVLLLVALASHVVDLGNRAMSHDESIHAKLSWQLFDTGEYVHDPRYHGPFLFHLNALVFEFLGDTDFTARLGPALAGILLVASPLLLRRFLGSAGALSAALLLSLSPAVLFYGRYLRNDIYMALFSVLWLAGILGYLESRERRWLWLVMGAMAASFVTKETAFLTGASLGSFVATLAAFRALRKEERWLDSRSGELALLMLTLVLPFSAAAFYPLPGWDPVEWDGAEATLRGLLVISALGVASVALAWLLLRGRRSSQTAHSGSPQPLRFVPWLSLFLVFWAVQILFFTSGFQNSPRGILSGVVGSLGYWLTQHEVERGSQPVYYYLILGVVYEFLALFTALAALWKLSRGQLRPRADRHRESAPTFDESPAPGGRARPLPATTPALLAWWTVTAWLGYSIAGERMPWLTVHLVVPMALLAGWWLGGVLERVPWRRWSLSTMWVPALAPLAILLLLARALVQSPSRGSSLDELTDTTRFAYALVLAALASVAALVWWRRRAKDEPDAMRLLVVGLVAALAVLTAQVSWRLSFQNDELATELMVYAHATPDIKRALEEVRESARQAGLREPPAVAFDEGSSWPMTWYLRRWPGAYYYGREPTERLRSHPVIVASPSMQDRLWPFLADDYGHREYRLMWWPHDPLTQFTAADVKRFFSDRDLRSGVLRYVLRRELPDSFLEAWPNRRLFRMYLANDLLDRSWGLSPDERPGSAESPAQVTEVRVEPTDFMAGPFDGKPLRMPTQIVVAPDGTWVVADAGNHRVVQVTKGGEHLGVLGHGCEEDPECDPERATRSLVDGAAPPPNRLKEPWGVTALPGGGIAVADTWHGRILFFDAAGRIEKSWGRPQADNAVPIPLDRLFGPRGLAYHPANDRLLIADTGHHRLLALDESGTPIAAGGPGVVEGFFQEPVGVAIDPLDGTVLVADTWNRRIQRFDEDLEPLDLWPVPGWAGREPYNKPFLAVDDRGLIYASDPLAARILVFDRDGTVLGALVAAGWRGEPRAIPLGVAIDDDHLLVADAAWGRIWILPLWSTEESATR